MPVVRTSSGSSDSSATLSATSPNRPRRTDGVDGNRVSTSSTAPEAARTTAAVGRHPGWSHSIEIATAARPRTPETSPTSTSVPVRYWRVRSITTRQHMTASSVPATPRETASGAISTSSRPTVPETATRISWATRASAPTCAGSISCGSAVMSAVE